MATPPLDNRHALVCGASAGIGRAAALALAHAGADVSVLARDVQRLAAVADEIQSSGVAGHVLVADLDDRPSLKTKVEAHLRQHGPVHIVVNNTGGPHSAPLIEATEHDFMSAMGRHLGAAQLLLQITLPGMKAAGYGRIINVLSTSVREPIPGLGVSGTVRSAMASWAKTLARELPPGITVNSVLPGYTATERLDELAQSIHKRTGKSLAQIRTDWIAASPEGRLGRPEEIAAAIAFLASPDASFIRGIVLPVDGGRLHSI